MAQLGPTDQGVHPGNQLGEIERHREVVERALEGAVTVFCFGDAVALLAERLAQEAPQVAVVLNDEYLHAPDLRPAASRGQCAAARIRSPRATGPSLAGCSASRATQRGALAGPPRSTDENSMRTLSYRPRGDPRRGPDALFPRQEGISSYLTREVASHEDADRCSRARGRSRRRLLSGPWSHRLHRPGRPARRPARRERGRWQR